MTIFTLTCCFFVLPILQDHEADNVQLPPAKTMEVQQFPKIASTLIKPENGVCVPDGGKMLSGGGKVLSRKLQFPTIASTLVKPENGVCVPDAGTFSSGK